MQHRTNESGFTLIETLVAITVLVIAVVAPMSLVAQSLTVSYYVRDEVTASYLAQEAIETIRNIRDSRVDQDLLSGTNGDPFRDLDGGTGGTVFTNNKPFRVDAHIIGSDYADALLSCSSTCPPVQTDGTFYGYGTGWANTRFTRTVTAHYIDPGPNTDLLITVTVTWQTGGFASRSLTLTENLYSWAEISTP
ncbi:MAG TPA: prepilin-type N-terminal cleavage/methylation domain-containing protein [Candidatus Paceibacterota bacterium]|nr:prepilin-type N-terminal cleavage/methylation domain-containing protein [Candidatus Paceibacterota bacterium]